MSPPTSQTQGCIDLVIDWYLCFVGTAVMWQEQMKLRIPEPPRKLWQMGCSHIWSGKWSGCVCRWLLQLQRQHKARNKRVLLNQIYRIPERLHSPLGCSDYNVTHLLLTDAINQEVWTKDSVEHL